MLALDQKAGSALAPTNSSTPVAYAEALSLVVLQRTFNEFHNAATFARLLCVSKQLRGALEAAAVGRLVATLALSTSQAFDNRFVRKDPEYHTDLPSEQLAWLSARLQQGQIRQLRLTGVSALSTKSHQKELAALMPSLGGLWTELCSRYSACFRCETRSPDHYMPDLYSSSGKPQKSHVYTCPASICSATRCQPVMIIRCMLQMISPRAAFAMHSACCTVVFAVCAAD
jgi:hypothetical protein